MYLHIIGNQALLLFGNTSGEMQMLLPELAVPQLTLSVMSGANVGLERAELILGEYT
jgi:hypothetical protein